MKQHRFKVYGFILLAAIAPMTVKAAAGAGAPVTGPISLVQPPGAFSDGNAGNDVPANIYNIPVGTASGMPTGITNDQATVPFDTPVVTTGAVPDSDVSDSVTPSAAAANQYVISPGNGVAEPSE